MGIRRFGWPGGRLGLVALVALVALALAGTAAAFVHPWRSEAQAGNGMQPSSVKSVALPGDPRAAATQDQPAPVSVPARDTVTAKAAVETYLRARSRMDAQTSYALLTSASRKTYPSTAAWLDALPDLPAPRAFTVTGASAAGRTVDVTVDVRREPVLDEFVGFLPARSVEVYRAARSAAGWRVDAEPVRDTAVLISDRTARADVTAWLDRVSTCDGRGAAARQVSAQLIGDDSIPGTICAAHERLRADGAVPMVGVPATAPFLAAYGPDFGTWARLVPVTGSDKKLLVGVAPLGSSWRVFGIVPGGTE